jgi:hypothetical protein
MLDQQQRCHSAVLEMEPSLAGDFGGIERTSGTRDWPLNALGEKRRSRKRSHSLPRGTQTLGGHRGEPGQQSKRRGAPKRECSTNGSTEAPLYKKDGVDKK